jgi:hypothetical protein
MRILLGYRQHLHQESVVQSYAHCFHRELELRGHEVTPFGEGHEQEFLGKINDRDHDLLIELDCGRNKQGNLAFQQPDFQKKLPSAVWFIDSHGHPAMHRRFSRHYGFVFFAVWDKRDLFTKHADANWLPNATDLEFFGREKFKENKINFDFGFFGSKGGLYRADPLKTACELNGWSYDIRQVNKPWKHMWPGTGEAMAGCRVLFNHGQKHDGPNLRVMESMAIGRPLITDRDPRSGMYQLFVQGDHYLTYDAYSYEGLEEIAKFVMDHPEVGKRVAERAYQEVAAKHTISNRVDTMLEQICVEL